MVFVQRALLREVLPITMSTTTSSSTTSTTTNNKSNNTAAATKTTSKTTTAKKINRTPEQKILWSLASTSYMMDMFLHVAAGKDLEAFSFEITRKKYYIGLSRLKQAKLIIKKDNMYRLTTLGKLIYQEIVNIGKAVQYSDALEAWDGMKSNFKSQDPDKLKAMAKSMFKDDVWKMISRAEEE